MLSHHLIRRIEEHADPITIGAIEEIRRDALLTHLNRLPQSELSGWGHRTLTALGSALEPEGRKQLGLRYEELGKVRHSEGIPLNEVVRGMQILKHRTIDFVREQGFAHSSVEIYAEEELEHRVDQFFDFLVYHLVRGYEAAWTRTQAALSA